VRNLSKILESHPVNASAACRIDCGGTLDIKTFYYPLRHLSPCTFNIALNLKTKVQLRPYEPGVVKVSSQGFESEVHPADSAPFDSPLGLMFAVAAYFGVEGLHIDIISESPTRSALGGSSSAVVALMGALSMTLGGRINQEKTVLAAHAIEEAVAGMPCGLQDHLAAAYGGVHAWYWPSDPTDPPFRGREVLAKADYETLEKHLLVAYCGVPHKSGDINREWIHQFVTGNNRHLWAEIVTTTKTFVKALSVKDWASAVHAMNREVEIRREITPYVFDEVGESLLGSALSHNCGARFAGAGGGGCLWALGLEKDIENLRPLWEDILFRREDAVLLEAEIDPRGLEVL